ncbi:WhiB family transcriptional regulator [Streptomyces sp. NPDC055078]
MAGPRPAEVGMSPADWSNAACARSGLPPDIWFAEARTFEQGQALRTCERCPISAQCLSTALAEETGRGESYRWGIWGGLTGPQRYRLARAAAKAAAG